MLDLFDELKTLIAALEAEPVDYAVCGGLAMAIHALPRATIDIDLLIRSDDLPTVQRIANDVGSRERLAVNRPRVAATLRKVRDSQERTVRSAAFTTDEPRPIDVRAEDREPEVRGRICDPAGDRGGRERHAELGERGAWRERADRCRRP